MKKELVLKYLAICFIFVLLVIGLFFLRYVNLTGFAIFSQSTQQELQNPIGCWKFNTGTEQACSSLSNVQNADTLYEEASTNAGYVGWIRTNHTNTSFIPSNATINGAWICAIWWRSATSIDNNCYVNLSIDSGASYYKVWTNSDCSALGTSDPGNLLEGCVGGWVNVSSYITTPSQANNVIILVHGHKSGAGGGVQYIYLDYVGVNVSYDVVSDTTPPNLSIDYPQNQTYNINVNSLNYTVGSDANWCMYYNGTNNVSIACGNNVTDLTSNEGSQTWIVYANDSSNNQNSSSVTFFKDSVKPLISYGTGTENSGANVSRDWIYVNVSVIEINFANITFNLYNSTGLKNSTSYLTQVYDINFTGLVDGTYYYNVTVYDIVNNKNSTEIRIITLDNIAPTITITHPQAKTYGLNNSLSLNFSASDLNLQVCWYNLNQGDNITLQNCQNTTFNATDGSHTLYLYANDSLGNTALLTKTFSISTTLAVSLEKPENNKWLNYNQVQFNYTVNTASSVSYCELYGNFIGSWQANQTNSSAINVTGNINIFLLNLPDGNYIWNVFCSGTYNAFALNNFTLNIDTISPSLILTEPEGTKSSRTITATWTVSDLNLNICKYNVYRGTSLEIGNTTINCHLNSTTFSVTVDAEFKFNFYVNDLAGNSDSSSLSFTVSTGSTPTQPPDTTGSGGGSAGPGPLQRGNIGLSRISDVVANPGESKTLGIKVKNLGPIFLNKCKLSGTDISSNDVKGLAVGQEEEFVFVLNIPEDFSQDKVIELTVSCEETEKSTSFTLFSSKNFIELQLISSEQKGGKFNFVYLVQERAGREQRINAKFELENSDGIVISEGTDSFDLKSGEELMMQGSLDLPDIAGEYVLNIYLESDGSLISLSEPAFIGKSVGFIGRAILVAGGGKILIIAIFVVLLAFVVIYVVRRVMRKRLQEDITGYVKVKLNK